ncbi:MAG: Holliday junction resolvase RuvX [Planctomycetota bacterium]
MGFTAAPVRTLAIDLGDKRTGLAMGDDATGIASPLGLIEVTLDPANPARLIDALRAAVGRECGPADRVAMGLPINIDGTEGPRAELTRRIAKALARALDREILLLDERRTSQAADGHMAQSGLTHGQKKARRDAIAAAVMLTAFLSGEPPVDIVSPPNAA